MQKKAISKIYFSKPAFLLSSFLLFCLMSSGQNNPSKKFAGSFLIDLKSTISDQNFPMRCFTDLNQKERKDVIEIIDDQHGKGILKRVMINYVDSNWTTTIGFNDIKQGTRVHDRLMFRDSCKSVLMKFKKEEKQEVVNNLACQRYSYRNDSLEIFVWLSKAFNYDVTVPITMLMHSGIISREFKNKLWQHLHFKVGMIVKVNVRDRKNKTEQTIEIKEIKPGQIDQKMLSLTGYRIADIPEGQNCGVLETEK